jgi:hypothetical protein
MGSSRKNVGPLCWLLVSINARDANDPAVDHPVDRQTETHLNIQQPLSSVLGSIPLDLSLDPPDMLRMSKESPKVQQYEAKETAPITACWLLRKPYT